MNIIFISNYLTHHQTDLCENLFKKTNGNFYFIQTERMSFERIKLGWELKNTDFPFFIDFLKNKNIKKLLNNADVIILGSTKINITKYKLKKDVLILFYSERLFKKERKYAFIKNLKIKYKYWKFRKFNTAILCASAFAAKDFYEININKNNYYKWGYFPLFIEYKIDELMKLKKDNILNILWVGRLINWKHCIDIIKASEILLNKKINFHLNIIGTGELKKNIISYIHTHHLENYVNLIDSCPFNQIRYFMEKANLYIMTSSKEEGWGVVVNEAMNSGCVVIGSNLAGSVPFLINHKQNGLIYKFNDINSLVKNIIYCYNNKNIMFEMGKNAYLTIRNEWNADSASERLLQLIHNLKLNKSTTYKNGPCSIASINSYEEK